MSQCVAPKDFAPIVFFPLYKDFTDCSDAFILQGYSQKSTETLKKAGSKLARLPRRFSKLSMYGME